MNIKKTKGIVKGTEDLTPTARVIKIKLAESVDFVAGSFVNVFININSEKVRRAYSISSSDREQDMIEISVRLNTEGKMTPEFWKNDIVGSEIEIMGPLGLNTANKMNAPKKYLFGFGIGAGVIKSLSDNFLNDPETKDIHLIFGHRNESEILYKEYFDDIRSNNVSISYVVSNPDKELSKGLLEGYIQNHISEYDFNNSDIYICGQEKACDQLKELIEKTKPLGSNYFIEGFH